MKKYFLGLLIWMMAFPLWAQKGHTELSLYGGTLSYKKIENPYIGTFSSGFGLGFQAKYFLANSLFWVTDLYGGTDDGTENTINTEDGKKILTLYRRDYSIATGVGVNFISMRQVQSYIQVLGGMGKVEGYTSDYISEKDGVRRFDLNRTSYLLSAGIGIDFSISRKWNIGGGYLFRYLGGVDGSHSVSAKISYLIP